MHRMWAGVESMNDCGHFWTPTAKQQRLIDALLTPPYPTLHQASEAVGVPYTTARRWRHDQRFAAALRASYDHMHGESRERAQRRLKCMIEDALRVKEEALKSPDLRIADKAANWLLEH